jgi:hypothetical protein
MRIEPMNRRTMIRMTAGSAIMSCAGVQPSFAAPGYQYVSRVALFSGNDRVFLAFTSGTFWQAANNGGEPEDLVARLTLRKTTAAPLKHGDEIQLSVDIPTVGVTPGQRYFFYRPDNRPMGDPFVQGKQYPLQPEVITDHQTKFFVYRADGQNEDVTAGLDFLMTDWAGNYLFWQVLPSHPNTSLSANASRATAARFNFNFVDEQDN